MLRAQLDMSDPSIESSLQAVRSDTDPTEWCLFGYEGKNKLVLQSTGTDGLAGLTAALSEESVVFGLLRHMHGDQESQRVKFIHVVYAGSSVPGMARGRAQGHKGLVKDSVGESAYADTTRPRVPPPHTHTRHTHTHTPMSTLVELVQLSPHTHTRDAHT